MKIAHVVCTFPPYFGGMGNVVFQTTEALRARGHEVVVITPQFGEPTQTEQSHVKRLSPSVSYGNAARLPTIKKELDAFDIVHLHYPFYGTANLVRQWKKKNPDKTLVVTYHMDTRAPDWKGLLFKLYAKFWMNKILDSADYCLASSMDYIEASDAQKHVAQHPDKWGALPFGVDTHRFQPQPKPEQLFLDLDLDPDAPTVVFVGGMDPAHHFKGIPVLLRALAILEKSDRPVQALFVGDGSLRPQFEEQVKWMDIAARTRFLGKVSDEDLPLCYAAADVCILPSTGVNEAFGMVLIEAYASGIPVIASDLPGVRSVASHAGITVPPKNPQALAEAIYEFFSPKVDRRGLSLQATMVAHERFSWERIAQELEALYTKLVGGK